MKNQGKIFEENFRKSLDLKNSDLFYYRFKDSPASFGNSKNDFVRFTNNNICDNMIFYKGNLFLCELKSHKGKSLPFSCIRDNQYKQMLEVVNKKNVFPMLIIFFSDIEECYAIKMTDINEFKDNSKSKSIPLLFARQKGLKIDCRKLQTNYRYNVIDFLENYIKNIKKEGI